MNGFITIDRALMSHWCATDPNFLAVWIWLLNDANWKDKKSLINSAVVDVKRGQLIFGLNAFSKKSGVSVNKLRRIIKIFEDEGQIHRQKTNKYSIISITKYDDYQSVHKLDTGKAQAKHKQNTGKTQHLNKDNNLNKETKELEAKASCQLVDAFKIIELWNGKGLGELSEVLPARRRKINSRTKDRMKDLQAWDDYFQMFADSNFLTGKSGKWKAGFDWALNPTNMMKVLEGNYKNDANGFDASAFIKEQTKDWE